MDFKIDNKYWISCFVRDFINIEKVYMKKHNIEMFDIETFLHKIIEKKLKYNTKGCLDRFLSKYSQISTNCILSIPRSEERNVFTYRFYSFLCDCDKDRSLDLTLLKFDLVQFTSQLVPKYGPKFYLFICEINPKINFELSYGTLKVLNKI